MQKKGNAVQISWQMRHIFSMKTPGTSLINGLSEEKIPLGGLDKGKFLLLVESVSNNKNFQRLK